MSTKPQCPQCGACYPTPGAACQVCPMPMSEVDSLVRHSRAQGECLGTLCHRYGARAVVRAMGVLYVAESLGVPEPAEMDEHSSGYLDDLDRDEL